MKRRTRKAPSAFEQEVLDVVLLELRRAMKMRVQLTVIIDPWAMGDGTYLFAAPNEQGRSYMIEKRERER